MDYLDSINQKRSDKQDTEYKQSLVDALKGFSEEVKTLTDSLETTGVKKLDQSFIDAVKSLESVSKSIQNIKIENDSNLEESLAQLARAFASIDFRPVIKVAPTKVDVKQPEINIDLKPVIDAINKLEKSEVNIDVSGLSKEIGKVYKAVNDLKFPVANYILPFKDINGRAAQVQLDSSGNLPVAASISTAGLATDTNQTNGSQKTQIVDAGGEVVTVTGGKLDVNASVDTTGLALDATLSARLSESDFDTKIGSLTETAPATDTASSGLNGRLQRLAQRVTSLIALFPTSLGQKTKANSFAVTLASDQDALPITDNSGSLTVDNNGTFATQATIQTGTNSIGKISDITTSVVPGTGATNLGKAEDAAHASGDTGVAMWAVRNDSLATTFTNTDGDYSPIAVTSNGRVYGSVVIDSSLPAGTNAIGKLSANSGVDIGDVDVTSVIAGTGATSLGKAEDAAHTTGDTGVFILGVRTDTQASSGGNGDYVTIPTDSVGAQYTTLSASTGAIGSTNYFNSALTSTKVAVNASGGNVYGYHIYNPNGSTAYVQFFNVASASVTVGTTTPNMVVAIPPLGWADLDGGMPIGFATALTVAATTTSTGSGNPTNGLMTNIRYK